MGQEDHVSMGSISGRKLLQVIDNVDKIMSIELLCAAQAKDFHTPLTSTPIIEAIHEHIRQSIPHIEEDQPMQELLDKALVLIKSGVLVKVAKQTAQKQQIEFWVQGLNILKTSKQMDNTFLIGPFKQLLTLQNLPIKAL